MNQFQKIALCSISALCLFFTACSKTPSEQKTQTESSHQHKQPESTHDMHHDHKHSEEMNHEHDASHSHGGLHLSAARVKPSIPGQKVSAAYLVLENHTNKDIEIVAIRSDVAAQTEFHTMRMEDNNMVMRQLKDVSVKAGGKLTMSEGGDHVMLMQLKQALTAGEKVNFSLDLDNGETFTITAPVVNAQDVIDHSQHMSHETAHEAHTDMHHH